MANVLKKLKNVTKRGSSSQTKSETYNHKSNSFGDLYRRAGNTETKSRSNTLSSASHGRNSFDCSDCPRHSRTLHHSRASSERHHHTKSWIEDSTDILPAKSPVNILFLKILKLETEYFMLNFYEIMIIYI